MDRRADEFERLCREQQYIPDRQSFLGGISRPLQKPLDRELTAIADHYRNRYRPPADLLPTPNIPVIPGYQLLPETARGGTGGPVRELALDRELAIKVTLPGSSPGRFLREWPASWPPSRERASTPTRRPGGGPNAEARKQLMSLTYDRFSTCRPKGRRPVEPPLAGRSPAKTNKPPIPGVVLRSGNDFRQVFKLVVRKEGRTSHARISCTTRPARSVRR